LTFSADPKVMKVFELPGQNELSPFALLPIMKSINLPVDETMFQMKCYFTSFASSNRYKLYDSIRYT